MRLRSLVVGLMACLALTACASKHPEKTASAKTPFAPVRVEPTPAALKSQDTRTENKAKLALLRPQRPIFNSDVTPRNGGLKGRTLKVNKASQIVLQDREVILTFDDGPIPGRTDKVLAILDRFNVKATFLMVGQMARNYSSLARQVADQGHTIGSHTYDHANLQKKGHAQAMNDIVSGDAAVRRATGAPVGFFRFPYLADTGSLRKDLAEAGIVVLDVDIDSKDYRASRPEAIAARTMAIVRAKGKGIILMHDIHTRTAAMLPAFLSMLQSEGYSVVSLRYGGSSSSGRVAMLSGL